MVRLQTFNSRVEAELAKGLLESEGIAALVSADDQAGLHPGMAFASGVDVMVKPEDLETAKTLLVEMFYAQ